MALKTDPLVIFILFNNENLVLASIQTQISIRKKKINNNGSKPVRAFVKIIIIFFLATYLPFDRHRNGNKENNLFINSAYLEKVGNKNQKVQFKKNNFRGSILTIFLIQFFKMSTFF